MKIEDIENPDDDICEVVNFELRTHNRDSYPDLWDEWDKDENQEKALNLFAFNEKHEVIGGLFGTTRFSWLKVNIMATKKALRGQGIGTSLLRRSEEIAKSRGCKYVFVDTMEHQAPDFYQKCGYEIMCTINDWDSNGHKKYFFTKQLK